MKENRTSWDRFIRSMIERGLRGVRLVVGDLCAKLVSIVNAMLPGARYRRCMVHFMRNVLSNYMHWYRDKRIKLEYGTSIAKRRRKLGLIA